VFAKIPEVVQVLSKWHRIPQSLAELKEALQTHNSKSSLLSVLLGISGITVSILIDSTFFTPQYQYQQKGYLSTMAKAFFLGPHARRLAASDSCIAFLELYLYIFPLKLQNLSYLRSK
jgi:hypothetical protein